MISLNLNYKKGAIRTAIILTVIFAIYGYQSRSESPWSWMWSSISGKNIAALAMKESTKEKCRKASVLDVQFDQTLENEKIWDHSTLIIDLNEDPKSKILGDDVEKDCRWIAELSHYLVFPDITKEDLKVTSISQAMYENAESVMKRRVFWQFIKDRSKGAFDSVLLLWSYLFGIAAAFYIFRWIIRGFKAK